MSDYRAIALATTVVAFANQLPANVHPAHPDATAQLADRAYREYSHKSYAASITHFEAYLRLRPHDAQATLQVAYAQAVVADHRGSAKSFDRYLQLRPGDLRVRLARGYEYYAAADFGAAARDFEQYLARNPADARVWMQLAYAQRYARWVQHDRAPSVAALTRYLELVPNDTEARSQRAYDFVDMGKTDEARNDFAIYLRSRPSDAAAWLQQSYLSEAAHDWSATIDGLSRYIRLTQAAGSVRLRRALAYLASGEEEPAVSDLHAFTPEKNEDPRGVLEFAYACDQAKHPAVAVVAFDRYIELAPTDDQARLARAYALKASGNAAESSQQLVALQSSSDPTVSRQATLEVKGFSSAPAPASHAVTADGSVGYESRFNDVVTYDDAIIAGRPGPIQPYGVIHFSTDSRSNASGSLPSIYNDNAVVFDAGLRHDFGPGHVYLEGGLAHSLLGEHNTTDLRYGYVASLQTGSERTAVNNFYFNIAGYSRYAGNVIGDAALRRDFRITPSLFGVVGVHAIADTHRDYFNNVAEIEAGIRLGGPHGIRLLAVKGWYLSRGIGRPTPSSYLTFRPVIMWDTHW